MTNDQEHDFLQEVIQALKDLLVCVSLDDADGTAHAVRSAQELLEQRGETK